MIKEFVYKCDNCAKDIEYGSETALCSVCHLFCCVDCALEHYEVGKAQWVDKDRFSCTPDESNGYGVCYMNDELFTNGKYVVFDKCKLNIDEREYGYFNCRRSIRLGELVKYHAKVNNTECSMKCDINSAILLENDKKMIKFVLKYSGNESGQFLSSEPDEDNIIVIDTNGVKAIVQLY